MRAGSVSWFGVVESADWTTFRCRRSLGEGKGGAYMQGQLSGGLWPGGDLDCLETACKYPTDTFRDKKKRYATGGRREESKDNI
jgi:hypothetical protein